MNPLRAYQNHRPDSNHRIDFILSHLRRTLSAFRKASEMLKAGDVLAAQRGLTLGQMILAGLSAGQEPDADELALNILRLYEFAAHQASLCTPESVAASIATLQPILEAFEEIESEARSLERAGVIPSFVDRAMVQVTA